MKKLTFLFVLMILMCFPAAILAGEAQKTAEQGTIDKKAAEEYFKHAGTATDPSYQDFIATTTEKEKNDAQSGDKKQEKKD